MKKFSISLRYWPLALMAVVLLFLAVSWGVQPSTAAMSQENSSLMTTPTVTPPPPSGENCTHTKGWWRTRPEVWPVNSMVLGNITYSKDQLMTILYTPHNDDATYILAYQFIAAKLNIANGADGSAVATTISNADSWLTQHPIGSNPQGADRIPGIEYSEVFLAYNDGDIGPGNCENNPPPPPAPSCPALACDVPYYSQNDPAWQNADLLTSSYNPCSPDCNTIGSCGCTLTGAAMMYNYYGANVNPGNLSSCMGNFACFFHWTDGMIPNPMPGGESGTSGQTCSGNVTQYNNLQTGEFNISFLEEKLNERGGPLLLGMRNLPDSSPTGGNKLTHWVVVLCGSGSDLSNYVIHDPWPLNGAEQTLDAYDGATFDRLVAFTGTPACDSAPATNYLPFNPDAVPVMPNYRVEEGDQTLTVTEARHLDPSDEINGSVMLYRLTADTMTLQLEAESTAGNVTQMLIWTDEAADATWQPFSPYVYLPVTDNVYVRFADEAGNVSQIEATTRYPTTSPPPDPSFDAVTLVSLPDEITLTFGDTFELPIWVYADTLEVDSAGAYVNFDKTVLNVLSITSADSLPMVLKNEFDNDTGRADFVAGVVSDFPSHTFKLSTVTFEVVGAANSTTIEFNTTGMRNSDATFGGASILNGTQGSNLVVYNTTTDGSVTLQGRPAAPHASWSVELTVSLTRPDDSIPAYQFTPTTDESGHFTISGVEPGTYEMRVKHSHTLENMVEVTLVAGTNTFDLGTLLEGDANNDNEVGLEDFSLLVNTIDLCEGEIGYDARADFNGNTCVTQIDFSWLATNYTETSVTFEEDPEPELPNGDGIASIMFQLPEENISQDEIFEAVVVVDSDEQVDGAQASIHYDPDYLEVVGITGGQRLPIELESSFDNQTGKLTFAAGSFSNFPSGEFELARIQFKALAGTQSTPLTFEFTAPGRTAVTSDGEDVLAEYTDAELTILIPTSIALDSLSTPSFSGSWRWALAPLAFTILAGALIVRRKRRN